MKKENTSEFIQFSEICSKIKNSFLVEKELSKMFPLLKEKIDDTEQFLGKEKTHTNTVRNDSSFELSKSFEENCYLQNLNENIKEVEKKSGNKAKLFGWLSVGVISLGALYFLRQFGFANIFSAIGEFFASLFGENDKKDDDQPVKNSEAKTGIGTIGEKIHDTIKDVMPVSKKQKPASSTLGRENEDNSGDNTSNKEKKAGDDFLASPSGDVSSTGSKNNLPSQNSLTGKSGGNFSSQGGGDEFHGKQRTSSSGKISGGDTGDNTPLGPNTNSSHGSPQNQQQGTQQGNSQGVQIKVNPIPNNPPQSIFIPQSENGGSSGGGQKDTWDDVIKEITKEGGKAVIGLVDTAIRKAGDGLVKGVGYILNNGKKKKRKEFIYNQTKYVFEYTFYIEKFSPANYKELLSLQETLTKCIKEIKTSKEYTKYIKEKLLKNTEIIKILEANFDEVFENSNLIEAFGKGIPFYVAEKIFPKHLRNIKENLENIVQQKWKGIRYEYGTNIDWGDAFYLKKGKVLIEYEIHGYATHKGEDIKDLKDTDKYAKFATKIPEINKEIQHIFSTEMSKVDNDILQELDNAFKSIHKTFNDHILQFLNTK